MALQKFNAGAGFSVNQFTYDITGNVLTSPIDVIDANANVFANNLTVSARANLGSISNVTITGGSANYILITDGSGNLSWTSAAGIETATGSNTQVQFNDGGVFGASAGFTFNKTANTLTVNGNITSTNANLGNLVTANYLTGTLTTQAQPNITSTGTLTSLNVSGNVSSGGNVIGTMYGNGYNLSGIYGSNVIGQVGNSLVAGTVYTAAQPNITSTGTLINLNVTGNVSSGGNILGNGQYLTSITGGNVTGQVGNALVAGTVYTAAQPNITSVGTLSSLTVTGLITATTTGIKTANIQDSTGTITIQTKYNNNPGDVGITSNLTVGAGGTGNLTVNGISDLGPVGNVKISGGTANYILQTDGAGNLSWTQQSTSSLSMVVDTFTANGSGSTFNLTATPPSKDYLMVNIDGVTQLGASYSVNSNVVTLSGTPVSGAIVEIKTFGGNVGPGQGGITTGKAIAMAIVFGF